MWTSRGAKAQRLRKGADKRGFRNVGRSGFSAPVGARVVPRRLRFPPVAL